MEKKKSLGQHFLHSSHYLGLIAEAAHLERGEQVLEIGPGDGALTEALLARGARLLAVEKDRRLIPHLREKFTGRAFAVVEEDALTFEPAMHGLRAHEYAVVGNIPYYITGALIRRFLAEVIQPRSMTLLIQKEVAERIARSKKESLLSLSVRAYGTPHYVHTVKRGAFVPPPKVDSAILSVSSISRRQFNNKAHEERFFTLLRAGFAQKRKLLARNLEPILGGGYLADLEKAGIDKKARAEDVPLEKWLALSNKSIS